MNNRIISYNTLAEIQAHKDELRTEIRKKSEQIGTTWNSLFAPQKASTRGELVTSIISNSITAFDAFMLVRKLMSRYGSLFRGRKKR